MDTSFRMGRTGISGAASSIITAWALFGGFMVLAVVAINVISVVGAVFWRPFPGDFELTEMGIAVAAFAFLPYCQLTGANVTADIFTARASRRWVAFFGLLASIVALGFAALLVWRMYYGLLDKQLYNYTTAILQVPIWWAFVPALISVGLLGVASLITLFESGADVARRSND